MNQIALYHAARKGDQKEINRLISQGASNWRWGLYGAIKGNHFDLVKHFTSKGIDLKNGIADAINYNHKKILKFLLEKTPDTPEQLLWWAACNGYLKTVKYFAEDHQQLSNPTNAAVANGHLEVVKYLLKKDSTGLHETLCTAITWKRLDMIEHIIGVGKAKKHKFDFDEYLMRALMSKSNEIYNYIKKMKNESMERRVRHGYSNHQRISRKY